jgi:hypothetical protein
MIKGFFGHIVDIVMGFLQTEEAWIIIAILGLGGVFIVPFISGNAILREILYFLLLFWWLWLFFILIPIINSLWLFWRQELFKRGIKWVLLELRMPRMLEKSPQAMEQVLKGLHSLRNSAGDVREKYWDGEVTVWFSLEMVSFSGEIHFYVRGQKKQRNLIEAAFYSYYPDLDIAEVDDYLDAFPQTIPEMYSRGLDMWGTEMLLARDAAYPIKSYEDFESEADDKKFDPISVFLEILGKLKAGEIVGIQLLIAPADADWHKGFKKLLEDIRKPPTTKMPAHGDEEGEREVTVARTPGQTEILEKVEANLSKPAFDTLIRFIYMSPIETYYDSFARRGLSGAFNQYASLNLNSFKQNRAVGTRAQIWNWPHAYPKQRVEYRKQRLLLNYLKRDVPLETWWGKFITSYPKNFNFHSMRCKMTTESIATLFHPPTAVVLTAPHMKLVESRKAGPPSGLAIFGEEGEIEQYQ